MIGERKERKKAPGNFYKLQQLTISAGTSTGGCEDHGCEIFR